MSCFWRTKWWSTECNLSWRDVFQFPLIVRPMAVSILLLPNQTFSLFKFLINHYFIFLANQNTVKSMNESFLQYYSLKLVKWNWNDFFYPRWWKFWSESNGFENRVFNELLEGGFLFRLRFRPWIPGIIFVTLSNMTSAAPSFPSRESVPHFVTTSSTEFTPVLIPLFADLFLGRFNQSIRAFGSHFLAKFL